MRNLFNNLIFAVSLLVACSGPTGQRKETPVSPQPSTVSVKAADIRCDFSSYKPVRIQQFDRKAITKRVQPEYPLEAVERGVQGRATVKTLVNEKGIVERACTVEGDEMLRKAAEKAALQWKFKPGYGLAFVRPKTAANPKNFAEVYIVFEFKLDRRGSTGSPIARP